MKYIGMSSSEQARRGYWRVVLAGDVFDLAFFVSNPFEKWPAKVERWRAEVNAGKAQVAAVCSSASVEGNEIFGARAIVDVHVLGADEGDSVGQVVHRMNGLVTNVDVIEVALVENADPIARDAKLGAVKEEQATQSPLNRAADLLEIALKLGAVVALVYVVATIAKVVKK
jgi:hypothetical protein